ncbi:SDR family oxidoreductase [Nocardia altamirensis]|uniref:SDR family oxidoreductase n=1 Tax=Nocardia altamirensis TaxID=472158 RepID=UPI000840836E|nr:NAD(P)H-binding protein [Nocardia altamirensis]
MILITGGRGAVATELSAMLHSDGLAVRVGSRQPEQLQVSSGIATVACDLTDPTTFPAALAGVTSAFLYAEATTIAEFVTAATEAGVEHIVLLSSASVLGANAAANPIGKAHLDAELGLATAPMTTSVLRPGAFAGNARSWAGPIKAGKPISLPYPDAYTDPIHERDIAAVAHSLLTETEGRGTQHSLTGPETFTFRAQLECIAEVTGRPVTIDRVQPEAWKQQVSAHMPAEIADGLLDYWRRTDGIPAPITDTVAAITGRKARSFTSWVEENVAAFTD